MVCIREDFSIRFWAANNNKNIENLSGNYLEIIPGKRKFNEVHSGYIRGTYGYQLFLESTIGFIIIRNGKSVFEEEADMRIPPHVAKAVTEAEKYLVNICCKFFHAHCWMVSISIWLWYDIETSLHADAPFQYPRKSSENLRYFQGVENGILLFAGGIKRKHWLVMD